MDFGAVALDDGLLLSSDSASDPETKHKLYGSAFHKQQRSATAEDDFRSSKIARTSDSSSKGMLFPLRQSSVLRSNGSLFVSDAHEIPQMLSFCSPKSEPQSSPASNLFHSRNSGGGYGGLNGGGGFLGMRAPFTPSQWMELEHQALIYKYITANVPVPSNLLIPIRKALESAGFSAFSGGFLRPTSVGWGSFNVGFSNNTDPEPGRCRRTDGKKWRCSRDAVADQKYCERHMNRGRHRSRKPVEGQPGHSVAGTSNLGGATTSKLISSPSAAVVVPGNGSSNSLSFANQHFRNLPRGGAPPTSAAAQINRMFKENGGNGLEDIAVDMKQKPLPFAIDEASKTEFGLLSSSFPLNPPQKSSSLINYRTLNSTDETEHSLRQFFNNWPKTQSDSSSVSWSNSNPDPQSDRTQLSISIPMASSDFRSSTSSPANEKVTLLPLKLSQELDPIQMGLGVGTVIDEQSNRQTNWIPISWESSVGGPLGEVLNSTNNAAGESKSSSALNLMTEGWDNNSPSLGSSPTGVLQKTAFGSFSNSSAGSSPKTHEGGSQCSDRVAFVNSSSSLPSV